MNTITKLQEFAAKNRDEEGAAMVEYGLLIFFLALAVILILQTLGPQIASMFERVSAAIV